MAQEITGMTEISKDLYRSYNQDNLIACIISIAVISIAILVFAYILKDHFNNSMIGEIVSYCAVVAVMITIITCTCLYKKADQDRSDRVIQLARDNNAKWFVNGQEVDDTGIDFKSSGLKGTYDIDINEVLMSEGSYNFEIDSISDSAFR